jgi:hypothetical protein
MKQRDLERELGWETFDDSQCDQAIVKISLKDENLLAEDFTANLF